MISPPPSDVSVLVNVFDEGAAGGDQSLSQAYSVLSKTLASLGGGNIIIKSHNAYAINPEKFGCDYYDYLKGDVNAINAYQGAYMANYATWSDLTGPRKFRS